MKINRFGLSALVIAGLLGCEEKHVDAQADRFTEITGARSEVERVYVCTEVAGWDAVRLRVLRDSTASTSNKEIVSLISEADEFSDKFTIMLDEYSSDEVKAASRELDKRFTDNELSQLLEEYGELLKAHCADMLE